MVVIEPEPESVTTPPLKESIADSEPPGSAEDEGSGSGDECFEDALTDEQLLERTKDQANDAKTQGNKLFSAGNYEEALSQYELALEIYSEIPSSEEVHSMCHANRAICFSKLVSMRRLIKECTKALELNPSYLKALLRRGEAHEKLEHYDEAITDMKKIAKPDPSNEQSSLEPLAVEKREKMQERNDRFRISNVTVAHMRYCQGRGGAASQTIKLEIHEFARDPSNHILQFFKPVGIYYH
ncbi:tetratricopeptide repeat protein 1 [Carex littledalei]|uniref:Tetratricopeptide repeat protein 1 n=1 Tax=Carex littledalei TaxID=544730 RepID=A0A833VR72_9POAL|nr:tetratricopeptide repeat protein 1 [Carex littledalei]